MCIPWERKLMRITVLRLVGYNRGKCWTSKSKPWGCSSVVEQVTSTHKTEFLAPQKQNLLPEASQQRLCKEKCLFREGVSALWAREG